MPDDHRRLERLRQEPRTDLPIAARALRFFQALRFRIVAACTRADPALRFLPRAGVPTGAAVEAAREGSVWDEAEVGVYVLDGPGSGPLAPCQTVGLAATLCPGHPGVPLLHAVFVYGWAGSSPYEPVDHRFALRLDLTPQWALPRGAEAFHAAWDSLCDRHSGLVDPAASRTAWGQLLGPLAERLPGARGLLVGPLRQDPEGAFLFIREAGRVLLPTYLPLLETDRQGPSGPAEQARQEEARRAFGEALRLGLGGALAPGCRAPGEGRA